jgi:hypothetical protein
MVKDKLEDVWVFGPYRGAGIVSRLRFDVADLSKKRDRADMAARVPLGIEIDADESTVSNGIFDTAIALPSKPPRKTVAIHGTVFTAFGAYSED